MLKRLERALKKVVSGLVIRVAGARALEPPEWAARAHRVLYLRYDRIGDMIMATGLLRAIAGSQPGLQLDVLASPSNASVLEGNPHVSRVLVMDRKRPGAMLRAALKLRRTRYDAVIDGMVLAPSVTTMMLMLATGARYRIGVAGRTNERFFTLPVPAARAGASAVLQQAQTALPFGVVPETTDWSYELFLREDELARAEARWRGRPGRPRLLVNVSAATADRRWPTGNFAALVRHLRESAPGSRLLVTGDPAEASVAARVAAEGGAEAVDCSPVREAFALVATADGLLTPDTSMSHAAAATGTPVAVLFRGDWTVQAPHGAQLVSILSDGSTLEGLPLGRALEALPRLLEMAARRAASRS